VMKSFFDGLNHAFPETAPSPVPTTAQEGASVDRQAPRDRRSMREARRAARGLVSEGAARSSDKEDRNSDVVCEEQILNAFSK
jgi:hypothetical protein